MAALETENARLRATLVEREQQIDRLNARALQESQIRLVADSLPVLISYVDAEGRYRFNNKAYERWFGRRRGEMYGRHLAEVLGESAFEALRPLLERVLAGERVSADIRLPYRDGGERHVQLEYVPDRRENGVVAGFYALVQDVSEAKRAEAELRESEARFRAMADCAPAPVWVTSADGIEFVNQAFAEVAGVRADQLTGEVWMSLIHPEDLPDVLEKRARAWQACSGYAYEARFRRADGEWRWMHVSCRTRLDAAGRLVGYVGMAVDFTERKRAQDELRESEARFRAMADSAPAPVWVTNEAGIEFANRALCTFTGLTVEELRGDTWMRLAHPDDIAAVAERRQQAWATKSAYDFEARFRRADGEWRWLRARCKPRETSGAFLGYVGLAVDVTDSRRTEDALRESEARFREVANAAPVLIWLADVENRGIWYNKPWLDFTGRSMEQELGHGWLDGVHPDDRARAAEVCGAAFARREPFRLDFRLRRADGEWRVIDDSAVPRFAEDGSFLGYIGSCVDVTDARLAEEALRELNRSLETRIAAAIAERERAEEALRQAQKMEAVGQLTGGIAHDFNNLLTVIGGNLDLAARRLGPEADPKVRRAIGNAMTGADRAATLTQRLLAFSRRQPLAPKPIDPNALLAGMTELLHRTLGETIEIETRLAAGLWQIEADPHQLESAILNLAVNARDAMPGGGRLVIETSAVRLEGGALEGEDEVAPGPYVAISVIDSGTGMNEDTRRRAVEPFFTTKDVGKGTGLGLSMVYGFVRQSGGHLRIDSEEGRGTAVHIYLPRLAALSSAEEQAAAATAPRVGGDETILVCEDDDDVRAYTVELLAELGYRVLEAHDGASTLRLLEDRGCKIDLLFTDVVLPGGTSGAELAGLAQAARPGLRVLFTTGYARDAIVHEGRLDPGIELVTKPFAFGELAARIRDVLDRG